MAEISARKQPGRRYGPAPKASPHPEMQAPKPMSTSDRDRAYRRRGFLSLTPHQARQWVRMAERNDEAVRSEGRKGYPAPKQKKVRHV